MYAGAASEEWQGSFRNCVSSTYSLLPLPTSSLPFHLPPLSAAARQYKGKRWSSAMLVWGVTDNYSSQEVIVVTPRELRRALWRRDQNV